MARAQVVEALLVQLLHECARQSDLRATVESVLTRTRAHLGAVMQAGAATVSPDADANALELLSRFLAAAGPRT